MAHYVEAFMIPLPSKNLAAYRSLARKFAKIWIAHGALSVIECVGDDVKPGKRTSFPQSVKLKADEIVAMSWVTFASRAQRNRTMASFMSDPKAKALMDSVSIFDGKRMFWGGFKTILEA
ncbi:MAG: DUF1428 family protein [Burkholderiaceae bacterium]|nr:DUF1428 family protein [Burkholderiaceae bacterium]